MGTLAEKIAESLKELKRIQDETSCIVLQGTTQLSRTHLKRLVDNGWLQEVIRG